MFVIIVVGVCCAAAIGFAHYRRVKSELEDTRQVVAQTQSRLDVLAGAGAGQNAREVQVVAVADDDYAEGVPSDAGVVGTVHGRAVVVQNDGRGGNTLQAQQLPAYTADHQAGEVYALREGAQTDGVDQPAKEVVEMVVSSESVAAAAAAAASVSDKDEGKSQLLELNETDQAPQFLRMVTEMDPDDPPSSSSDDSSELRGIVEERRADAAMDAAIDDDLASNASDSVVQQL